MKLVRNQCTDVSDQELPCNTAFLGNDLCSTDQLELLVSLHFLVDRAKPLGLKKEEVISFLKSKKPYFTDQEINGALSRLQELGVLGNC